MRLIDADAVSELLWSEYHGQKQRADYQAGLCHAMMTISRAKTINPKMETVKWLKISPAGIYECSGCGQNVFTSDIEAYRFCHGCGKKVKWNAAD